MRPTIRKVEGVPIWILSLPLRDSFLSISLDEAQLVALKVDADACWKAHGKPRRRRKEVCGG